MKAFNNTSAYHFVEGMPKGDAAARVRVGIPVGDDVKLACRKG